MENLCRKCPIVRKITTCCESNPDTGETRTVRLKNSGQTIAVCNNLKSDGTCEEYAERPEPCKAYVCEPLYAMGLDSST
jgi:hypothetical protein